MSSNVPSFNANSTPAMRTSKRSKYSRFIQQEVPYISILANNCLFILVGVFEIVDRYLTEYYLKISKRKMLHPLKALWIKHALKLSIQIYAYYQLDNFYQNHRSFVFVTLYFVLILPENVILFYIFLFLSNCIAASCGLIAWSFFNDTYSFSHSNNNGDHKFGKMSTPRIFKNGSLIGGAHLNESIPLSKQEDLILWMRTASLLRLKKLYGKIEVDLEACDVTNVTLKNNYNTYSFNSIKKLVHSTTNLLGGKHVSLLVAYASFCHLLHLRILSYKAQVCLLQNGVWNRLIKAL
ncbi:hypothetical protein M9H77_36363 [Catharanthus roseus]|uniref:Uncharacterized protein n=1 Tax=Catharanthus roseus TaxID=4058 RepID=A0ACB9ZRZ7_CATRO|nr:hypothetical protein M9H77_36363 [Catharanthus roseus]